MFLDTFGGEGGGGGVSVVVIPDRDLYNLFSKYGDELNLFLILVSSM